MTSRAPHRSLRSFSTTLVTALLAAVGCANAAPSVAEPQTPQTSMTPVAPVAEAPAAGAPSKLVWRARYTQPRCDESMITCKSGEKAGDPCAVAGKSCLLNCAVTTLVCTAPE